MGILSKLLGGLLSSPKIDVYGDVRVSDRAIPPLQGDYAKAVFLWYFSKRPSPFGQGSSCPRYFLYECGIQDVSAYHKRMIEEGYLEPASTEGKLGLLKVSELKDILARLGLSVTGKKSVLIQRILDNASVEALSQSLTTETYSLSEKGKAFLAEHDDHVKLHRHGYLEIGWREYDAERQPGFGFYDTVWRIVNKRIILCGKDLRLLRQEYLKMYRLLEEEERWAQALEMLLRILYIDLCWDRDDILMFAPGIIVPITKHKDVFSDVMIDRVCAHRLSRRPCSKELFSKIVHSLMDGTFDEKEAEKEWRKDRRRPADRS